MLTNKLKSIVRAYMNKKQFIGYCWCRDYKYIEAVRVACQLNIEIELPSREEYKIEYDRLQELFLWAMEGGNEI